MGDLTINMDGRFISRRPSRESGRLFRSAGYSKTPPRGFFALYGNQMWDIVSGVRAAPGGPRPISRGDKDSDAIFTPGTTKPYLFHNRTAYGLVDRLTIVMSGAMFLSVNTGSYAIASTNGTTGGNTGFFFGRTNRIIPSGLTFYGQNGSTFPNTSNTANLDRQSIFACKYRSDTGEAKLFQNGILIHTANIGSGNFNTTPNSSIMIGGDVPDGSDAPYEGKMGWIALWNRYLPDSEIIHFMKTKFHLEIEETLEDIPGGIATLPSFSTGVGVSNILGVTSGPISFVTGIGAGSTPGGIGTPSTPGAPALFNTDVGVRNTLQSGVPELASFSTQVSVGGGSAEFSAGSPVTFSTQVGCRNRIRAMQDGRLDVLGSRLYRR